MKPKFQKGQIVYNPSQKYLMMYILIQRYKRKNLCWHIFGDIEHYHLRIKSDILTCDCILI